MSYDDSSAAKVLGDEIGAAAVIEAHLQNGSLSEIAAKLGPVGDLHELTPDERKALAHAYSNELAHLVKPEPAPFPPMSMYTIQSGLMELLELREQAEEDGALPDELAAIDAELDKYILAEAKKVDGVCHAIRAANAFAAEAEMEILRLRERRDAWVARAERIKAATLRAMQTHGVKRLETATNRLRVQNNGGVQPLDVNATALSPEYLQTTVTLPMPEAERLGLKYHAVMPDNAHIRDALARRVPCPECHPKGRYILAMPDCPRCEGKGTVQNYIPGARLLERGVHLRVE